MAAPAPKHVVATWRHHALVFDAKGAKAVTTIDGDNTAAPGPMETLLLALTTCTGVDVLMILKKKRLDVKDLVVEADGTRRDEEPHRFIAIKLRFMVTAAGATEQAVRHAIDLSLDKYCSVRHSLNPDIPVTYELALQA